MIYGTGLPRRRLPAQPRRVRHRRSPIARRTGATAPRRYLGHRRPRLPESVHAVRPEHERCHLDHLHPRGSGRIRPPHPRRHGLSAGVQAVDIRREIHDAYNAEIQRAMEDTVWLANCNNYYRHPNGEAGHPVSLQRNHSFAEMLARVELDEFDWLSPRTATGSEATRVHPESTTRRSSPPTSSGPMRILARRPRVHRVVRPHTSPGDWPTLFGARHRSAAVGVSLRDPNALTPASSNWRCSHGRSEGPGRARRRPAPADDWLSSCCRCSAMSTSHPRRARPAGFDDGVRRIEMPAPRRQDGGHGSDHRAGRCPRRADRSA